MWPRPVDAGSQSQRGLLRPGWRKCHNPSSGLKDFFKGVGERLDAGEVRTREGLQLVASPVGEREVYTAVIEHVALAVDQACAFGSLSELDGPVAYV